MATQHLEPKAKSLVDKCLGAKYSDDIHYLYNLESKKKAKHTKEIHFVHLDGNLQPMKVEGDDAYVALLQALDVVAAHESHSDAEVTVALRTVINLMSDIHLLSSYRIESIPYSQGVHTFTRHSYDYGPKKKETSQVNWHKVWGSFSRRYTGFSGEFWAYEMNVGSSKMKEEYSKGTLKDWTLDIGTYTKDIYGVLEANGGNFLHPTIQKYEEFHMSCLARAAFRIAVLLNDNLK